MNRSFIFTLSLFAIGPLANAQIPALSNLGQPYETEARRSVERMKEADEGVSFQQLLNYSLNHPERNEIVECAVFPQHCTPGNILLFRGEERFSVPGISAMVRSRWKGSGFAAGKDLNGMLLTLENRTHPFANFEEAPDAFSGGHPDRLLLEPTHNLKNPWKWTAEYFFNTDHSDKHTIERAEFKLADWSIKTKEMAPLTVRQIYFSFHVNTDYFYFSDEVKKSEFALDPLVSFSTVFFTAVHFAVGNSGPDPMVKRTPYGRLIVLSVPPSAKKSICSRAPLIAGEIFAFSKCSRRLGRYEDDEAEWDVVAYPNSKLIRYSFLIEHDAVDAMIEAAKSTSTSLAHSPE